MNEAATTGPERSLWRGLDLPWATGLADLAMTASLAGGIVAKTAGWLGESAWAASRFSPALIDKAGKLAARPAFRRLAPLGMAAMVYHAGRAMVRLANGASEDPWNDGLRIGGALLGALSLGGGLHPRLRGLAAAGGLFLDTADLAHSFGGWRDHKISTAELFLQAGLTAVFGLDREGRQALGLRFKPAAPAESQAALIARVTTAFSPRGLFFPPRTDPPGPAARGPNAPFQVTADGYYTVPGQNRRLLILGNPDRFAHIFPRHHVEVIDRDPVVVKALRKTSDRLAAQTGSPTISVLQGDWYEAEVAPADYVFALNSINPFLSLHEPLDGLGINGKVAYHLNHALLRLGRPGTTYYLCTESADVAKAVEAALRKKDIPLLETSEGTSLPPFLGGLILGGPYDQRFRQNWLIWRISERG